MKIRIIFLVLVLSLLSGCASTRGKVVFLEDGVEFELDKSGKIYYKQGDREGFYDTQTPSLVRTLIEGASLRELNKD